MPWYILCVRTMRLVLWPHVAVTSIPFIGVTKLFLAGTVGTQRVTRFGVV